jgi:hypothetical protein
MLSYSPIIKRDPLRSSGVRLGAGNASGRRRQGIDVFGKCIWRQARVTNLREEDRSSSTENSVSGESVAFGAERLAKMGSDEEISLMNPSVAVEAKKRSVGGAVQRSLFTAELGNCSFLHLDLRRFQRNPVSRNERDI